MQGARVRGALCSLPPLATPRPAAGVQRLRPSSLPSRQKRKPGEPSDGLGPRPLVVLVPPGRSSCGDEVGGGGGPRRVEAGVAAAPVVLLHAPHKQSTLPARDGRRLSVVPPKLLAKGRLAILNRTVGCERPTCSNASRSKVHSKYTDFFVQLLQKPTLARARGKGGTEDRLRPGRQDHHRRGRRRQDARRRGRLRPGAHREGPLHHPADVRGRGAVPPPRRPRAPPRALQAAASLDV